MSRGRRTRTKFMRRIKDMSLEQLQKLRDELRADLSDLNRQRHWTGLGVSALGDPARLQITRKNIARIETRINELRKGTK